MRASRLVSLVLLLQARGRMTAAQLAAELEVSVRTVYRDVESLAAAGVPVYGEAGVDGGYRLLDGYRTRLTGLTGDEAEALFLTGLPGPAAELGLGAVVATAALKLRAALPPDLAERADRIQERFHLDAPGWYADADRPRYLPAMAAAVWEQRRVRLRYRRWRTPTDVTRTLSPYGVVLKAGTWYLVGADDRGPRTYRVNQILAAHVLDETFTRPAGFDLAGYWRAHVSRFRAELYQREATIRLSPRGRSRAADLLPDPVRAALADTAGAPDGRGWVTATVPIETFTHAESQFLRFGADVEILAPAELRDRLAATARGLAALYG